MCMYVCVQASRNWSDWSGFGRTINLMAIIASYILLKIF